MQARLRLVAAMQLALIVPAGLFLAAVLVATGDPPQYELAHIDQRLVTWYSVRPWTLPILLLVLPFVVLVNGGATLLRSWNADVELPHARRQSLGSLPAPIATLFVAATTLTSVWILAVVVLHMMAN